MLRRAIVRMCARTATAATPAAAAVAAAAAAAAPSSASLSLLDQLPHGWKLVDAQQLAASAASSAAITATRERDEDGVVQRSEAEHRRIFQPYSTAGSAPPLAVSSADAAGSVDEKEGAALLSAPHQPQQQIHKTFSFGHFGPLYHWMGKVGAMAGHIGVYPALDWFFMEVHASLPLTVDGLHLAWYMNDEEALRGERRNVTEGGLVTEPERTLASRANNPHALPRDAKRKADEEALGHFCWLIAGDSTQRELFTGEIYLQWYHRADYLLSRKAKEVAEYRNNLTLEQVLQSASQNRKRRRERADEVKARREKFKPMPAQDLPPHFLRFRSKSERAAARDMQMFGVDGRDGSGDVKSTTRMTTEDLQEMSPSRHQFAIDTLPREVRESLESEGSLSGMGGGVRQLDPVAYARPGSPKE